MRTTRKTGGILIVNEFELKAQEKAKVKKTIMDLLKKVHRNGMDNLIKWLDTSSFFEMPASTKYHGNYDGGLAEHSLNVYRALVQLRTLYEKQFGSGKLPLDSVIIVSLCHDFCKIDFYKKELRNVKNIETGKWEVKEVYGHNDQLGMGHGEASVFMIQRFIPLTKEEILAIRWHMGAYDSAVKGGDYSINSAEKQTPLVPLLHMADSWASKFMEKSI